MDLTKFILPACDLAALRHALDGVGHEARLHAVREWGGKEMAPLFEAAADNDATTLEDFVPAGVAALTEVIHHGKNSLPVFTEFQKRFCRPGEGAPSDQLWGYNEQTLKLFTGPGYFVTHPWKDGGVVIDYTMVPGGKVSTWPAIAPNSAGLSRFIYNGTQDVMRKVSEHVTIGRARRGDVIMDNWFALVREDKAG